MNAQRVEADVIVKIYRMHDCPIPRSLWDWEQSENLFAEYPRPLTRCEPAGTWWLGHQTRGAAAPGPALNIRRRTERGLLARMKGMWR